MKRYLLPVFSAVALVVGGAGVWIANGNDSPGLATTNAAPTVPAVSAATIDAPPVTNGTVAAEVATTNLPPLATIAPKPSVVLPPPVADVVKLSRSSVGDPVLIGFIGNIKEPFTLDADQIIYLSDIGFGTPVLNALLNKAASAPAVSPGTLEPGPAVVGSVVPANVIATAGNAPQPQLSAVIPGGPEPQVPAPVYSAPQAPQGPDAGPVTPVSPGQTVGTDAFYDNLSPYGTWVQTESYGWCWQPTVVVVNTTWQPYCDGGHWVWSDYGWYWQSTYSWGWAPFHYGRWHRAPSLGWVWVPGSDWGPAWVAWRQNDRHCGWAPLPPECYWTVGGGYSWHRPHGGVVDVGFGIGHDWWFACSWGHFCEPVLAPHCLRRQEIAPFVRDSRAIYAGDKSVNIIGNHNTVIINNGISKEQVQTHTRGEIRKVDVREVNTPEAAAQRVASRGNSATPAVGMYRPTVPRATGGSAGAAPYIPGGRSEPAKVNPGAAAGGFATLPSRPDPQVRVPSAGTASFSNPNPNPGSGTVRPNTPVSSPNYIPGGAGSSAGNPGRPNNPSVGVASPAPAQPVGAPTRSVVGTSNPGQVRQDPIAIRQIPTTRAEIRKPEPAVGSGYAGQTVNPSAVPGAGLRTDAPARPAPSYAPPTTRFAPGDFGRPDTTQVPVMRTEPRQVYSAPAPVQNIPRAYAPTPAPAPVQRNFAPPPAQNQNQNSSGGRVQQNNGHQRGAN